MLRAFLRPIQHNRRLFHTSLIMSRQRVQQQDRSFSAACCIIGDEILNGKTRDSNAYFLGKKKLSMTFRRQSRLTQSLFS